LTEPENLVLEPDTFRLEVAGREWSFETGALAKQAGGAVLVRYGETAVLVTATQSAEPREGIDFLPLLVDYEERQYAAGRIPGNFFRREGRPTERAILAARLTDRSMRPLIPKTIRNDIHIVCLVLCVDHDNAPEICALVGASAALALSDVPFAGPVGAVIVGRVDGRLVVNPTAEQEEASDLHLVVAGTKEAIMMVEAGAEEVPESVIVEALELAHAEVKRIVATQEQLLAHHGRQKREAPPVGAPAEIDAAVRGWATERLRRAIRNPDKKAREADTDRVKAEAQEYFAAQFPESHKEIDDALGQMIKEEVRQSILLDEIRPDGRRPDEIRPISCHVGLLPRVHGSGLFTRGQTQVLTIATLGSVGDVQLLDSLEDEEFRRYMHHYNFPSFSVGETRPIRGPSRRDIGHGALAARALEPVIPEENDFPYTLRLVSEVLESNGSSSMASVCGSTLALMDAGVPIRKPVAGIAMGLVKGESDDQVVILSDIQGLEDAVGDMDFKVAGTPDGITALQMDIKAQGLSREILALALERARAGRMYILEKMLAVIPEPRAELSPYAPRITVLEINPDKIRDVIGPGGKTINRIIAETEVRIDIEDDGRVFLAANDAEACEKAIRMIEDLTRDVVPGQVYKGKVTRIMNFGAFVEVLPGKEGLVHISELANRRVGKVEDVVKIGDEVTVKVIEIDNLGRINLSRKAVLNRNEGEVEAVSTGQGPTQELELHKRNALKRKRRRRR